MGLHNAMRADYLDVDYQHSDHILLKDCVKKRDPAKRITFKPLPARDTRLKLKQREKFMTPDGIRVGKLRIFISHINKFDN